MTRVLVAGVGNVFFGDDGFGVEAAVRLRREPLPEGVRVLDAGIRSRDLAYELADGAYDAAIVIDLVSRGGAPGTVYLIEPDLADDPGVHAAAAVSGHDGGLAAALQFSRTLGAVPPRTLLVGCEPASVEEGIGLSPPVAAAVDEAVALVRQLLGAASCV